MLNMRRTQVAMEYMVIIGFVSITIIFLISISNLYQRDITDQVVLNQADQLAREIVDAAESVYFLGEPSKTTISTSIPARVNQITIGNREVAFEVKTGSGISNISYSSLVNLTGELSNHEGKRTISLEARCSEELGCYVNITE